MKNLTRRTGAKVAAVILFVVLIAGAVGGCIGIVFMNENGYYDTDEYSFYDSYICAYITRNFANNVFYNYLPLVQQSQLSEQDAFAKKNYEHAFSEEKHELFLYHKGREPIRHF